MAGRASRGSKSPMNSREVWKIAADPTNPNIIFAGTRPASLYRSNDGGHSWRQLTVEMAEECPNVRVPRVTALAVDPANPRRLGWGRRSGGRLPRGAGKFMSCKVGHQ